VTDIYIETDRRMHTWRQKQTDGTTYSDRGMQNFRTKTNKKFELMLTRHAKAYSSSGSVV